MITLMPVSLVEAISKKHGVCREYAGSRYDLGICMIRMHVNAYGFIPTSWSQYMRDTVTTLELTGSTTKDEFMGKLMDLQVKRLAWITRLIGVGIDEDELLEMSMIELAETVEDHCEFITCTQGTRAGGMSTVTTKLVAPKRAA